jgi:serine/threonine protein kinase
MNYPMSYGAYTLLEPIGKGGMSAIELAQTTVAGAQYVRFLVIKRMLTQYSEDDSFVRMFQDEARINAELQHANIAQVYDFGHIGDEYYMAMEYVPGVDLRTLQRAVARKSKRIPIRITLRILADVLQALHYAHNRVDTFGKPMRIVHRDVNPRNIMISIRGEIKLIDFGVAKSDTKKEQTIGHVLKGKFSYMSPEQIEGTKLDSRGDLFSVGLVLHELVENRRPFVKMHEMQILKKILAGAIPPMEGPTDHPQPGVVRAIHQRSLEVNPDNRYQSAKEMREALVEAAQPCGGLATDGELAGFVSEILAEEVKAIGDRLLQYREDVTHPNVGGGESPPVPRKTTATDPALGLSDSSSSEHRTVTASGIRLDSGGPKRFPVYQVLSGAGLVAMLLSAGWMWQQGNRSRLEDPSPIEAESQDFEVIRSRPVAVRKTAEPLEKIESADKDEREKPPRTKKPQKSRSKKTKTPRTKRSAQAEDKVVEPAEKTDAAPDERKEAPVEKAWVFVTSQTTGLDVFIDGKHEGKTPLRTQVLLGARKIRIHNEEKDLDYVKTLEVKKQANNSIHAEGH